jgi:hypothetical protein
MNEDRGSVFQKRKSDVTVVLVCTPIYLFIICDLFYVDTLSHNPRYQMEKFVGYRYFPFIQ